MGVYVDVLMRDDSTAVTSLYRGLHAGRLCTEYPDCTQKLCTDCTVTRFELYIDCAQDFTMTES